MKDTLSNSIAKQVFVNGLEQAAIHRVTQLLKSEDISDFTYHNLEHTQKVAEIARLIADNTTISERDRNIVVLAAWFHDVGYYQNPNNHEQKSAQLASDFLGDHEVDASFIRDVEQTILSTHTSTEPENITHEILKDADLHYLGNPDYFEQAGLLKAEWENLQNKPISDREWYEHNLRFFENHEFHTQFARNRYESTKTKHLSEIRQRLRHLENGE